MEWPARKARSKNDVKYKEHVTNTAAVLDGAYESTDTYKSGELGGCANEWWGVRTTAQTHTKAVSWAAAQTSGAGCVQQRRHIQKR